MTWPLTMATVETLCAMRTPKTAESNDVDPSHLPFRCLISSQEALTDRVPMLASPYELRTGFGDQVRGPEIWAALESGDRGFVHGVTTGSTLDGPGVRIVAWLTGCQFQCLYCHNPDTWKLTDSMPVSLARAVEVIQKYRRGMGVMKGGLTISGGEPLLQQPFVLRIFAAAKERGVHTALDTNGYLGDQLSDANLELVDLVLLDLKALSPDLHRRLTGLDNQPVLQFAQRLAARHKPVWVRFVVVPGWTDEPSEVERVAKFAADLGNIERVDVLPFHQLGRYKWEKLGLNYPLARTVPPSATVTEQVVARFRAAGLPAY
jgi:pyruvate formate lyase activating enzyme